MRIAIACWTSAAATVAALAGACTSPRSSGAPAPPAAAPAPTPAARAAAGAGAPAPVAPPPLGCRDVGIYSDLDARVSLALPGPLDRAALALVVDEAHATLVLYERDWPLKVYPLLGEDGTRLALVADGAAIHVRAVDAVELAPLVADRPVRRLGRGERVPPDDRDADGIPDPLDVLIGGKKLVANAASYTGDYFPLTYPGGDAPRDRGSCADVVIRALRNAGLDLQVALAQDLARAPSAYPMVATPNPSIDHRRVRTMLPYFRRHLEAHGVDPADASDPFRPGDVVFMDTLPGKPGPDHVGVVSDARGASGWPLVINNWTDGHTDAEMDLLGFVPVLERYRLPARRK